MPEKHNFKSTEELYGVPPKVLADLPYKVAIELKKEHAQEKVIETLNELADLYKLQRDDPDGKRYYDKIAKLDASLNSYLKAIELAELQLAELEQ